MKKWIQNSSLFFKLLAGGLVPILLTVLLSFIMIAYFFENSSRANKIDAIVSNIMIQILQARLAEKNFTLRDLRKKEFYQSGESKYLERHRSAMSSILKEIQELVGLSSGEKRESAEALRNLVDDYDVLFLQLVAAYRERGFKDWGLLGEWRQAIHDVEHRIR